MERDGAKELKISLIVPNTRYDSNYLWSILPSRGLLSLASVLKKSGHEVDYIDADIDNLTNTEVTEHLLVSGSNVAGITMNTFQTDAGIDLAKAIKRYCRNVKIVIGGPHPSAMKKKMLSDFPEIDFVCIGESEETIVELAKAIDNAEGFSDIVGIAYRDGNDIYETSSRKLISDLDSMPFPAYELAGDLRRYPGAHPVLKHPSMHIMASRGCPFSCIFCTKSVWGRTTRFRSPQNIVDEVKFLHRNYGINEIFFQDDTMNLNREWFFAVCDEIVREKLNREMAFKAPFRVNKNLLDKELLEKAREAGFYIIFYGVESGNQVVLDTIKKGTTIDEIKRAFKLTHDAGLKTIAAFMVGNVGDTPETIHDSIELAKEIKPSVFGFSIATPLPGTEFFSIANENKWIHSGDLKKWSQFIAVSRNDKMTAGEITYLRDKADREVRAFLNKKTEVKNIMPFPRQDPYWDDTYKFLKDHVNGNEKLVAPVEFEERFQGRILPYSATLTESNFQWVVISKAAVQEINFELLTHTAEEFRPVFANEVFVVFSKPNGLPEINKLNVHYRALEEKMKAYENLIGRGARNDEPLTDKDYSSLGVEEIKDLMNKRYSNRQAYKIGCLWDKVRAEELNRRVVKMIAPAHEKRILEIGCGIGRTVSYIDGCREFIGTDLSEEAVSQANREFANRPDVRFFVMDAMNLEFEDDYFDVVIAKEVIEHLLQPELALREAFRVLKHDGVLLLTSPNRDSLHLRVNRKLGFQDFKCSFDHIKEFTFQEAVRMLREEGFEAKDTKGVFLQPYWGIPGIDEHVRHLTDNDPEMVELLRKLGEHAGAEFAFCFIILAAKSVKEEGAHMLKSSVEQDASAVSGVTREKMIALNYDHHRRMKEQSEINAKADRNVDIAQKDNAAYEKILGHIPASGRCLELGAAYGGAFEILKKKFKEVAGVEIYEPAVKTAQENGLNIILSNLEDLPFEGRCFDAVVSRHVMEHTYEVDTALKEIKRVLKNGGYAAAITPHYFPDPETAHITKFIQEEWEEVYRRNGFSIVHSSVEFFNCEECHIVARSVERSEEVNRLRVILRDNKLTDPEIENSAMELAYLNFYTNDYENAINIFLYILEVNPKNINAMNNLGVMYWTFGYRDKSLKMFRDAYRISPNDFSLLLNMVKVMTEMGDYELMNKLVRNFLNKYQGLADRLIRISMELRSSGDTEKAKWILESILNNIPNQTEAKKMLRSIEV